MFKRRVNRASSACVACPDGSPLFTILSPKLINNVRKFIYITYHHYVDPSFLFIFLSYLPSPNLGFSLPPGLITQMSIGQMPIGGAEH